jgi:hypothetical protein
MVKTGKISAVLWILIGLVSLLSMKCDPDPLPAEVTDLSVVEGDGQVTLSWVNPSDDAFSHVSIRYGTGGTADTPFRSGANPSGTTITGLTNGETYTFVVRTVYNSGESSNGRSIEATPHASNQLDLTILRPTQGAQFSKNDIITFEVDVQGLAPGQSVDSIEWSSSGTVLGGTSPVSVSAVPDIGLGESEIQVTVTDTEGNVATAAVELEILDSISGGIDISF